LKTVFQNASKVWTRVLH